MKGSQALYGTFYGLNEGPFALVPDPRFLFLAARHREAFSVLRYGLTASRGFTLLTGDAGTGKTTLLRAVLAERGEASGYVLVSNPTLDRSEFYEVLAGGFELSDAARRSKTTFLAELDVRARGRAAHGVVTGLIVDEAQSLSDELLEEIRLLGNLMTPTANLLNIVLSGQPELGARLNQPSLRQLKQRMMLRCALVPLDLEETAAYMAGRLRIAGGSPVDTFTWESVVAVHELSEGLPRLINVLYENALIGGFAEQLKPVPVEIVEQVARDFDLRRDSRRGPPGSRTADGTRDSPGPQAPPEGSTDAPVL